VHIQLTTDLLYMSVRFGNINVFVGDDLHTEP